MKNVFLNWSKLKKPKSFWTHIRTRQKPVILMVSFYVSMLTFMQFILFIFRCLLIYSIFLSGTLEGVRKSVIAASEHALNNINILNHDGGHPRKGAVNLNLSRLVQSLTCSSHVFTKSRFCFHKISMLVIKGLQLVIFL